jgi:hypothetical protein
MQNAEANSDYESQSSPRVTTMSNAMKTLTFVDNDHG